MLGIENRQVKRLGVSGIFLKLYRSPGKYVLLVSRIFLWVYTNYLSLPWALLTIYYAWRLQRDRPPCLKNLKLLILWL